jgi:hypothetical protein
MFLMTLCFLFACVDLSGGEWEKWADVKCDMTTPLIATFSRRSVNLGLKLFITETITQI